MHSMDSAFDGAVEFLSKELSPDFIKQLISADVKRDDQHLGLGIAVRNVLRRSEVPFDDVWLDNHWFDILKEAIKHG